MSVEPSALVLRPRISESDWRKGTLRMSAWVAGHRRSLTSTASPVLSAVRPWVRAKPGWAADLEKRLAQLPQKAFLRVTRV
jgi:hypothetical protein